MVTTALLLADPSPHLRLLILKQSVGLRPLDREILELEKECPRDPLLEAVIPPETRSREKRKFSSVWQAAHMLKALVYLGYPGDHPAIQAGATYIFDKQNPTGSWSPGKEKTGESGGAELQLMFTAVILQSLALAGYGMTQEALHGYSWLEGFRLPDGAWPAGVVEGNYRGIAGYRRLPHSQFGCRTTTTAVAAALAYHPEKCRGEPVKRALDHLLAVGLREPSSTGYEIARVLGFELKHGMLTYYSRYDTAFILNLCTRVGIGTDDSRVMGIIDFLTSLRGPAGLWDYPAHPRASRWVTYDILTSLSSIDTKTDWFSLKPGGKFRKYPGKNKRF